MKDKGLYKHGMYGDRDSMGKKAVHRKMGEYFPKQSSQLTEDGMAIDASRTPGMEMYEAGMAQKYSDKIKTTPMTEWQQSQYDKAVDSYKDSTESWIQGKGPKPQTPEYQSFKLKGPHKEWKYPEGKALRQQGEEPNPNEAKSGKIYTDEQIASMSDRKKIRKGLAAGVESEGFNPAEKAYKFTLGGKIKTESYDVGGGETVSFNAMRNKNPNFKIGGNPEGGGASGGMGFGGINAELPKPNIGGLGIGKKIKEKRLNSNMGSSNRNSHYLNKGNRFSAKKTTRRHKKGF